MEKKISFGFSKVSKKPTIVSQKQQEERKIELIDCLEGQAIKIKDAVEEETKAPLNIPVKENARSLLDRIKGAKTNARKKENNTEVVDDRPDSELTLDELAARELIKEAKARLENQNHGAEKIHELPLVEDKPSLDGAEVPSLEDYENVPIGDYGMAMLRGMGWKEGTGIGKNAKIVKVDPPECRPKGLGLGASKVITEKNMTVVDKDGKELIIKPKAYAKITAGHHKDEYCQIQSLDDENALVIVKTAIKGDILKLNDIFLIPVTKEEYDMRSRVLNNKKYEEYKEISDRNLEKQKNDRNANTDTCDPEAGTKPSRSSKHSRQRSHSKSNTEPQSSYRQRSSSEDSEDQTDSSHSSRSLKQHKNGGKYHRKKSPQTTASSESDSADSRYGGSSRSRLKSRHDKKDLKNESSNSKGSKKHRQRDRNKHRSRSSSSESGREETRHRKNKNKSKHRSRSSSSESGYERNRRRKNKTKSRHRRYSNEESEESYKKNRKHRK